jgi:hypothetical protein
LLWGNRSDFYFGAKSTSGALKVSLHENGIGYVAYTRPYLELKRAEGISLANKTVMQWKLPIPGAVGAVHVASIILPGDFYYSEPLRPEEKSKTLVLGIEDKSAAEIGLFLSREPQESLEPQFTKIGTPLALTTLDNGLSVSIVVRSRRFDPADLPSTEKLGRAQMTLLKMQNDIVESDNLNAMFWNDPGDGGTLQVVDIGGVKLTRNN